MKQLCCALIMLWMAVAQAATVQRTELSPKRAGVFSANANAALNTTSKQTLVVWQRNRSAGTGQSLWGRLLSSAGAPAGAEFQIVTGPNTFQPSLAYNPIANQFVLVYSNELTPASGRFTLQAQRLNAMGRKVGTPVTVSAETDKTQNYRNLTGYVEYDAATDGYIIVWQRTGFGTTFSGEGLLGSVRNVDLTVRKASIILSPLLRSGASHRGPYITDLMLHAPSGKLLIAGYTVTTDPGFSFKYFVARTVPALPKPNVPLTPVKSGSSTGAAPQISLVLLPNGSSLALFVEGTGVKRRAINALGAPNGTIALMFAGTASTIPLEFPVGASATSQGAVVGLDDSSSGTGSLWFQSVGSTGATVGSATQIQTNISSNGKAAIVALPSASPLFAVVYIDGVQTTPTGQGSNPVLLKVTP